MTKMIKKIDVVDELCAKRPPARYLYAKWWQVGNRGNFVRLAGFVKLLY